MECPGCGKPRPAGTRFYLTADAPVVTDAAQLAEANAGADWICGHCAASTRATQMECGGCGAARGTSPTQPVIHYGPGQVPRAGGALGTAPAASHADAPEDWICRRCGRSNPPSRELCRRCHKGERTLSPMAAWRRRMANDLTSLRYRLEGYVFALLILLPILFIGGMAVTHVGRAVSGGGYDYEVSEWGTRTSDGSDESEGRTRTPEVSERGTRTPEASEPVETRTRTSDYSTDLGNGYFDDGTGR